MLGFNVSESTVSNYLATLPHRRPSQGWRTFLGNHLHETIAVDFAVVPTIRFTPLYVFVVLDLGRRRILHVGVTAHPTAIWTVQRLIEALGWDSSGVRFLIRDRDGIYGVEFRKRVRGLDIEEVVTARASPWQNGYCERVVGTLTCVVGEATMTDHAHAGQDGSGRVVTFMRFLPAWLREHLCMCSPPTNGGEHMRSKTRAGKSR